MWLQFLSATDSDCASCLRTAADQKRRDAPSIVLPHQQADFVRHIAIDIGGSLIKLVYFSPEDPQAESGDAAEKGRNHAGGKVLGLQHLTTAILSVAIPGCCSVLLQTVLFDILDESGLARKKDLHSLAHANMQVDLLDQ